MVRASPHLCQLVSAALSLQGAPKGNVTPVPPFLQLSEGAGVGQHPRWTLADQGHGCGVLSQPLRGVFTTTVVWSLEKPRREASAGSMCERGG